MKEQRLDMAAHIQVHSTQQPMHTNIPTPHELAQAAVPLYVIRQITSLLS